MNLKEWAIQYLRHRDLFYKKILSIEEQENQLLIKNKDGEQVVLILTKLEIPKQAHIIITNNLQENLDFLVKNWQIFASLENLKIIFANPKTNEKWIIIPHHHAKIAEAESLKTGLEAMFSEVTQC